MMSMRRGRPATVGALVSAFFLLALMCPCPFWTAQSAASEHDCCPPAAGVRAAVTDCCAYPALPSAMTFAPATSSAFSAPAPLAGLDSPAILTVSVRSSPPLASGGTSSVLRI